VKCLPSRELDQNGSPAQSNQHCAPANGRQVLGPWWFLRCDAGGWYNLPMAFPRPQFGISTLLWITLAVACLVGPLIVRGIVAGDRSLIEAAEIGMAIILSPFIVLWVSTAMSGRPHRGHQRTFGTPPTFLRAMRADFLRLVPSPRPDGAM